MSLRGATLVATKQSINVVRLPRRLFQSLLAMTILKNFTDLCYYKHKDMKKNKSSISKADSYEEKLQSLKNKLIHILNCYGYKFLLSSKL